MPILKMALLSLLLTIAQSGRGGEGRGGWLVLRLKCSSLLGSIARSLTNTRNTSRALQNKLAVELLNPSEASILIATGLCGHQKKGSG